MGVWHVTLLARIIEITANLALWSAYCTIPILLLAVIIKQRRLPLTKLAWLLGLFTLALGTVFVVHGVSFWWPDYPLSNVVKLASAAVCWAAIIIFSPMISKILQYRSPEDFAALNQARCLADLCAEIAQQAAVIESFDAMLVTVLQRLVESQGWFVGHALLVNLQQSPPVTPLLGWYCIQPERGQWFKKATEQQQSVLWDSRHFILQAIETSACQWITDLSIYPYFDRPIFQGDVTLKSAVAMPVFIQRAPLLVIEFLSETPLPLNDHLLKALQNIGESLSRVYEKQESEKEKKLFVATLSHDLKTPLQSELKVLEYLSSASLGPVNTKQQHALEELIRSNRYLYRMVNNLLTTYQFEAGRMTLSLARVDMNQLIREVMSYPLLTLLEEKQQILDLRLVETPQYVQADSVEIQRVLYNLIQNAINYSPKHSTITVKSELLGHSLKISVIDEGQGITPAQLAKLFQPYKGASMYKQLSTGLGLYLSRQIIDAHQGVINADTSYQRGACFWFILPLADRPTVAEDVKSPVSSAVSVV